MLESLSNGFATALDPTNLLYVLLGVVLGTVIGVLPGLGPAATIAVLLPLTYGIEPASAIILLAGIYYGSMYGGTITSVLLAVPGEAASVVTTIDGHQLAKQGRAGPALGIAAIGSYVGGTVAVIAMTLSAPLIASVAMKVGPREYALLAVMGILLVAYMGTASRSRSLLMATAGLLLACVGQDPISAVPRLTGGSLELLDGFDLVIIAMGLFGVAELLNTMAGPRQTGSLIAGRIRPYPTRSDLRRSAAPIGRGSVLGFIIGCVPGGSGLLSALTSYAVEKRVSKDPSRFGRGAIEGVAGPETANNAASTSGFVPLLTLGLPTNPVLALLLGALMLQNVTPGPRLIEEQPTIFWGVVASMYIGNVILLFLNLPLVGLFASILRVRPRILATMTLVICLVGVYSVDENYFDVVVVVLAGLIGFVLKRARYDVGPLVLAFVLGVLLETSFRQAMLISNGDPTVFASSPLAVLLLIGVLLVLTRSVFGALRSRKAADNEESTTDSPKHEPEMRK